jgi:leucyl-tRNA synthetase
MINMNFGKIEKKWQRFWKRKKLFEPEINSKEAFYIQVAYPYPSGSMHIGHARTYTVTDIIAKFNLMKGKNVLMPMGWHVSGTPVIAAVEALQNGDAETIKKFRENFHIPEKELEQLKTPAGFVKYMIDKAEYGYKKGFNILGLGIDWRRELTTIDPQYNKFIEWQYRKLKEKGYVKQGTYPVRFCPHDNSPVGDHDLSKGEGVGISEMTLLKFEYEDAFLVAGTLRPETVFGQTNLWINPDVEYGKYNVNEEKWIMSEECANKLKAQGKKIVFVEKIKGKDIIGKHCKAPGLNKKIIILPAGFCDPNIGTGIVTSVPSDAPYDYIALKDMTKKVCEKYGLDYEEVKNIKPIPIIKSKYGEMAAETICKEMGIKSQKDVEKLEKATAFVYKEGFNNGVMIVKKLAGKNVKEAKEDIKKELIANGEADVMYELEDEVVCRCGTRCIVNVLDDQWFVAYGDSKWKEDAKATLENMNIIPELYRTQYENSFDWLDDKPCTREKGLGTKFPFEKNKIVEPLGDSTIYMAYFTISHLIKDVPADKLTDKVFDYIFLGEGDVEKIKKIIPNIEEMRASFEYWYPLQYNVSAIELIPNHMSFSIFQHTAIFPESKRQLGTLNLGMVIMEGQKMSSSKGNVILINDICKEIGVDMVRLFLMNSVEIWEEMDWRTDAVVSGVKNVKSLISKLEKAEGNIGRNKKDWLTNKLNQRINNYLKHMEKFELRKAVQEIVFQFIKDVKWHIRRGGIISATVKKEWAKAIAPFMPHVAEELWSGTSRTERSAVQQNGYSACKESVFKEVLTEKNYDEELDKKEDALRVLLEDLQKIAKMVGEYKRIYVYAVPGDKELYGSSEKFLSKEMNAKVKVYVVNDKGIKDPEGKAKKAKPGKPGVWFS